MHVSTCHEQPNNRLSVVCQKSQDHNLPCIRILRMYMLIFVSVCYKQPISRLPVIPQKSQDHSFPCLSVHSAYICIHVMPSGMALWSRLIKLIYGCITDHAHTFCVHVHTYAHTYIHTYIRTYCIRWKLGELCAYLYTYKVVRMYI